jgi:hypothetical protein
MGPIVLLGLGPFFISGKFESGTNLRDIDARGAWRQAIGRDLSSFDEVVQVSRRYVECTSSFGDSNEKSD